MSQAYEQLLALGGERCTYTPYGKTSRSIVALIDPVRRTDALGNQSFLTKTYDVFIVKSASEGVAKISVGFDTLGIKLNANDAEETLLRITKISPERDNGVPGDGIGMWHLEAVA